MAYCPNCGREGNSFCSFCGTTLILENQDPPTKQEIIQKPKIILIALSLLCFIAGLIIYVALRDKPESAIYLKYSGISALTYIAIIIGVAFIPF